MNKKKSLPIVAGALAALALTACETLHPAPAAPPLPLGDYANAEPGVVARDFNQAIAARYLKGAPTASAAAELGGDQFSCAPGPKSAGAPTQVCRRAIAAGACTYTWRVYLYDDGKAALSRAQGLYDRTCGEELLGR